MREILFRGKTYDGKWEQGDLRHGGYVHNDSETYIMRSDYALHNIPVDPKTVGEYTGLTDKNGQKIFEGDIVKIERGLMLNGKYAYCEIGKVVYEQCCFFVVFADDCRRIRLYREDDAERYEIIGNIHDNPELLKGE